MSKQKVYHIIEWVVALAACGYLVYELATYDQYDIVAERLRAMGWQQWVALVVCVALMPVNMALEAWRWVALMNDSQESSAKSHEELSFAEAQRQVYYSKLAGVITPWRLGEYPARGLVLVESLETRDERSSKVESGKIMAKVLSMGAVGSATMTMAIVIAGVCGLAFNPSVLPYLGDSYLYALCVIVVVLMILFLLMPKVLRKWANVNTNLLLRSVGQSLLRLGCWCVQLGLVIWALGGIDNIDVLNVLEKTFIYYLLVTVTPNVPIVEAGVRGAWAMFLFGTPNAALAGVLLWAINTLLPCVLWPFVRKRR